MWGKTLKRKSAKFSGLWPELGQSLEQPGKNER